MQTPVHLSPPEKDTSICPSGTVQLNATSGFTSYTWTPSSGLSNASIQNPVASPTVSTTYVVSATGLDASSQVCTSSDTIKITIANKNIPTLDLGPDINLCAFGTHVFTAGNGFYNYVWNDGSTNKTYTAYGPGKYWVTVKDSCGGIQSDTVKIIQVPSPPLNLMADTMICKGDGILITFTPSGTYNSYQWAPDSGLSCVHCSNPLASPHVTTTYFLLATTPDGCTVKDSIIIGVNSNVPVSLYATVTDATCGSHNGAFQIDSIGGGTPSFQYNINNGGYSSIASYTALAPGIYSVTVKDSQGCLLRTNVNVSDHPGPTAISVITTSATVCEASGRVSFSQVTGGTPSYLFSFDQNAYSTILGYTGLNAGTYSVSVKDSYDCIYTTTFTIGIIPEEESIVIPNCFTPNSDTINDIWFVKANCVKQFSCSIYDRWGVLMTQFTDISGNWDGKHNGATVPDGVYYYVVNISFTSGKIKKTGGSINLIR